MHEDSLKVNLTIEDPKIEVLSKVIDHSMVIREAHVTRKTKSASKMKARMVKANVSIEKTSRLEKVTAHLYDLEDASGPEKKLNVDFGLYQMEDY